MLCEKVVIPIEILAQDVCCYTLLHKYDAAEIDPLCLLFIGQDYSQGLDSLGVDQMRIDAKKSLNAVQTVEFQEWSSNTIISLKLGGTISKIRLCFTHESVRWYRNHPSFGNPFLIFSHCNTSCSSSSQLWTTILNATYQISNML